MPHQGAVVFAVLLGQICDGGSNARSEELLSLVQVTLVDFIQKVMVSAGEKQRIHSEYGTESTVWGNVHLNMESTHSGILAARCSICSISDWKKNKGHF